MDKKFIFKLINQCFKQYHYEMQTYEINEEDYEALYKEILEEKQKDPDTGLHDLVNDVVYAYLTQN
ncbi:YqzH family protein [Heyndrickxia sp. NPDC080065]|uniref:YqzH family protein n=1 Tax=Heyndrickxia sp. NPDC080065 TaxID=3390568 RepID=UPI003D03F2EC